MRTKYKKAIKRRPRSTKKVSKSLRIAVEKIISRDTEDKYNTNAVGIMTQPGVLPLSSQPGSFGSPLANTAYTLLPDIGQGTNYSQRLGDKIKPKSLVVDWVFSLAPLTVAGSSLPLMVRLLVLKDKEISGAQQVPTTPLSTELLLLGNGSVGGAGIPSIQNILTRVNRKRYTVITDKVMKLDKGSGSDPDPTNSSVGNLSDVSVNSVHRFRTRIPCPAALLYPTTAAIFPSNFAPFFTVMWAQANGDLPAPGDPLPAIYVDPVAVAFVAHFDYEDA